jgi:uncharacterized repeat protein (TIGR01451 family)
MGSTRLRQGPQQHRLAGISWRSTFIGLILGVALLSAAPSTASAAADLAITGNVDSPDPVLVGGQLTYTITVQNQGLDPATSVSFTHELASGLSPVSATASPGTCTNAPLATCDLGTIAAQGTVTVTIVAAVGPGTPPAIVNDARVASRDDTLTDNNYSETDTRVSPVADLALSMTDVPDPVTAGDLLTYSLVVANRGPSTATAVRITDTLPTEVNFVTAASGCSEAAGVVTCEVGSLASGQEAAVDITVRTTDARTIANEAKASSPATDPDTTNNAAFAETVVSSPPSTLAPGDGGPKTGPLEVVLTGSYVLISGRSVKLVKGRFVPVRLTCAGQRKCAGTITVTTAKPVAHTKKQKGKKRKKAKRRVAKLGSKKFAIDANRQQRVLVPLAKSKVKLLRRLKRVKAKAAIREIDLKGHPRISTRTFTLRAR